MNVLHTVPYFSWSTSRGTLGKEEEEEDASKTCTRLHSGPPNLGMMRLRR